MRRTRSKNGFCVCKRDSQNYLMTDDGDDLFFSPLNPPIVH